MHTNERMFNVVAPSKIILVFATNVNLKIISLNTFNNISSTVQEMSVNV